MIWNRWYTIRSYVRSSLWIVPFLALVLEQILFHSAIALDSRFDPAPVWPLSQEGTSSALQTVITLTISFLVFTFGSMLVAIQVASGQLSPRIIATTLLRDNIIRGTVGLFVFTLLFAIGTVSRAGAEAPNLVIWIAVLLGLMCLSAFLFLIDYTARLLRPVSIVWRLGEEGRAVIEDVYPRSIGSNDEMHPPTPRLEPVSHVVTHRGTSSIILAVNIQPLLAEAERLGAVITFRPRVGDFVATGDPLMQVHGAPGQIEEAKLAAMVAFGPERTMEQDSTFAFRVIVDIAIKALSKAINDPTTAVLAIDQLQRLLRMVGRRHLNDEQVRDATGKIRVLFPTPDWENFVELAFSEIRLYGAENFQVARRLRAMIENLTQTLPPLRHPALQRELALLEKSIDRGYALSEDRKLARIPDTQGLGGSSRFGAIGL